MTIYSAFETLDKRKFYDDPICRFPFRRRMISVIKSLFGMYIQLSDLFEQMHDVITEERNCFGP